MTPCRGPCLFPGRPKAKIPPEFGAVPEYRVGVWTVPKGVIELGRKLAPCGTKAAYDRHLKNGESPCAPCRHANTLAQREKREKQRQIKEALAVPAIAEKPDLATDLMSLRDLLWEGLRWAAKNDPRALPALSRELSLIWKEHTDITAAPAFDESGAVSDDDSDGGEIVQLYQA